jgi:hypothetical protein
MHSTGCRARADQLCWPAACCPDAPCLQRLDLVLLLAKGHRVFFGPPQQAPAFAAAVGLPCPPGSAIAEHLLHIASRTPLLQRALQQQQQQQPLAALAGQPPSSHATSPGPSTSGAAEGLAGPRHLLLAASGKAPTPSSCRSRQPPGRELGVLFWRVGTDMLRTPGLLLLHLALAILSGLLVGLIFFHLQVGSCSWRGGGSGVPDRLMRLPRTPACCC